MAVPGHSSGYPIRLPECTCETFQQVITPETAPRTLCETVSMYRQHGDLLTVLHKLPAKPMALGQRKRPPQHISLQQYRMSTTARVEPRLPYLGKHGGHSHPHTVSLSFFTEEAENDARFQNFRSRSHWRRYPRVLQM